MDALESDAARLRSGENVHWVGLAGDSFRTRIDAKAQEALATCGQCEGYATALDDLAATLESRQAQLAALIAEAGATVDEVRDAVVNGAGDALDVAQAWPPRPASWSRTPRGTSRTGPPTRGTR